MRMMGLQTKEEAEVEYHNWCNRAPTCNEYFDSLVKANKEQKYAQKQKESWKSYLLSCTDDEVLKQMQDIFEKKFPPSKKIRIVPDNEEYCLETKLPANTVFASPKKAKESGNMTFLNGNENKNMPGKEKSGGGSSSMVFNNRLNFMNVTSYIETSPIWDVTALLNDADIKPLTLRLIKNSIKMEINVYSIDETGSGYKPDKFMMTFDLMKNTAGNNINQIPFYTYKPHVLAMLKLEDFGIQAPFNMMESTVKRLQPYGENKMLVHVNNNAAKTTSYQNYHDIAVSFIYLKDSKTIKEQVEETINSMAAQIVSDSFQQKYVSVCKELFSKKVANLSKPHKEEAKSKLRSNLWVVMLAGLINPVINYKKHLKYGLTDEAINSFIVNFFPNDVALPNKSLWPTSIKIFAFGGKESN